MLARLKELNVELVVADDTIRNPAIAVDLNRIGTGRPVLPVNLIYPPNYPEEPAILLEVIVYPSDVLKVLDRMAEIQEMMKNGKATPAP